MTANAQEAVVLATNSNSRVTLRSAPKVGLIAEATITVTAAGREPIVCDVRRNDFLAAVEEAFDATIVDRHDPVFVVLDTSLAESTPASILRFAAKVIDDGRSGYETEAGYLRDWAEQIEKQVRQKPSEPRGLGAVVLDAAGEKWIRIDEHFDCDDWARLGAPTHDPGDGEKPTVRHFYRDIDAVEVLSEGVIS